MSPCSRTCPSSGSNLVAFNAGTQEISISVPEGEEDWEHSREPVCEHCAVPMLCRILIILLFMLLGAVVGFVIGLLFAPWVILPALQWSLFMGTSLDGWQNVDAFMFLLRTGKGLKTPKTERCKHLKCSECSYRTLACGACFLIKALFFVLVYFFRFFLALGACWCSWLFGILWCPVAGLITGFLAAAIIANNLTTGRMRKGGIYDAVERVLFLIKILKVQDHQKYKEGKSEGRRKLDGTRLFYMLLCAPFVVGWCGVYITYIWIIFPACFDESYLLDCNFALQTSLSIGLCLLLPLVSVGTYLLYTKRLDYLDEALMEPKEEILSEEMEALASEDMTAEEFMDKYNELLEKLQNCSDVSLTEEEENWVRLSFLLVEEGAVWVAKIITKYLHDNGLQFAQLLNANQNSLQQQKQGSHECKGATKGPKKQKLITPEQYDLLFPATGEADIGTLDLTLLVLVIGLLQVLNQPSCGWNAKVDPPATDLDKASDLVRMRLMRNHLYAHIVECAIKTADFERHWDKLVEILKRLGAKIEELDKLKDREVTKEQRSQMSKRITTLFRGDLPDAEEFAQEKMKELAENHRKRLESKEEDDLFDDPRARFI